MSTTGRQPLLGVTDLAEPAGAVLVDYGIGRGDVALMGAVTGVGVGVMQA